ncbi:MAG: TIM barrel protein [Gammaproteobacteria bacterium]|nr:TIM barrel protein [Gammaproteobacteria bacterium]
MLRFSANLGFLWTELALTEAVRAAARAGFDAVECHWPYEIPEQALTLVLAETGLPMVGLNTVRGDTQAGDNGLAAMPGREQEARAAIDQAVDYAAATGTRNVHVMAGKPDDPLAARKIYVQNLRYAAERAAAVGVGILIEPLNHRDAPGYFLREVEQAAGIIGEVGADNLRIMFDCYHVQIMQGDLIKRIESHLPLIGHIQFAAVPSRQEPDEGELCFERLLAVVDAMGYDGYIGAEYKPRASTDAGLGWLSAYRR